MGDMDEQLELPDSGGHKRLSVERIYQKKTQLEHILLRPDSYIGSVSSLTEMMWVMDVEQGKMVQREVTYVPGLFKIFDEILVNAADNKVRDSTMTSIKIDIDPENNKIKIWNSGKGIPVVQHKTEKMFVPTMIFGHLLTSSNYDDTEKKVTGGRNGYGAKLCNIFSTKFIVETSCQEYKKSFKQVWTTNMTKTTEPKIDSAAASDFTCVTFHPDLPKFGMEKLDKDIVDIFTRRAYDIAGSTSGVKVFLNGKKLPIKSFKDYVDLYLKDRTDENDMPIKVVHEKVGQRWEVAVTSSDKGFQQASFVNSIATTKGGRHVDYIVDQVVNKLIDTVKKKNKGGITIRPFQIRNHLWVFVNCQIENPSFDSQTKENMTLQSKSFGSKPALSEKFINHVNKCGVVESILTWMSFKAKAQLQGKCKATKTSKLKGIPKLDDANDAGTRNSMNCTLILTEGDSAKALVVAGLSVVGRDKYGVFPLKGKVLNVREASHKQIMENAEINNIIKILGLQYKFKYDTPESLRSLRYGKLMIMTDQDQDGSHIKGLIINFLHHNWPDLLQQNFVEQFITPIVKVSKRKDSLSFYSMPEFDEWKSQTSNWHTWKVKYYKGLGTSTAKEAKEYFSNMERHRIRFKYAGTEDDSSIELAFSKKKVDDRKEWLATWMDERKRRAEMDLPDLYLYGKQTKQVTYNEFVNRELILFSNMDNERSIPSMVDGLKPGQRKVMFTCFKRNDKNEIKVAQLAGSVAEHSSYHHGEVSLMGTIINLAQNFVGSNNLNLLQPIGQFGTRLYGGKDSASPRYIFTMLSSLARCIFHVHDEPTLKHLYDDNQKIEPEWYCPIIPMVLVNGAEGIGTGWSTRVSQYNPRDLVEALRAMMRGDEPKQLLPWFRGFTGTIDEIEENRYIVNGEIAILDDNTLEITELPVRTWTQTYKESVLEPMLNGSEKSPSVIQDYKEYHTEATVRFVVKMVADKLREAELNGLHKFFKIQASMTTNSMVLFDHNGCIRKYNSPMEILREFYTVRLERYQIRKDYLEGLLAAEALKLENMARFILEIVEKKITVDDIKNKNVKELTSFLLRRGYDSDPLKAWKLARETLRSLEMNHEDTDEELPSGGPDYHYLYEMQLRTLTKEKREKLLKERDDKGQELRVLRRKTPKDLWTEDLDAFITKMEAWEEQERAEAEGGKKTKKEGFLKGKKTFSIHDCQPSPHGLRVEPKIEVVKKEKKAKKAKDEDPTQTSLLDAFSKAEGGDEPKSLAERLGLKKGAKKTAAKKDPAEKKPRKPKNTSASPKKKKRNPWSDSEDDMSFHGSGSDDNDVDRAAALAVAAKERGPRRSVAQNKKYVDLDDEESPEEEEFFDNPGASDEHHVAAISDDDDVNSPKKNDDDDDIFPVSADSPVPKTKTFDDILNETHEEKNNPAPKKVLTAAQKKQNGLAAGGKQQTLTDLFSGQKEMVNEESGEVAVESVNGDDGQVSASSLFAVRPDKGAKAGPKSKTAEGGAAKKKAPPKKKKLSDSEDESPVKKKKKKAPVKRAKKPAFESDSDDGFTITKKKGAKRKRHNSGSDVSDVAFDGVKVSSNFAPERVGRPKKQVKYTFSDDNSE